jgi:hypothetical protein
LAEPQRSATAWSFGAVGSIRDTKFQCELTSDFDGPRQDRRSAQNKGGTAKIVSEHV